MKRQARVALLLLFVLVVASLAGRPVQAASVIYVDADAPGLNDGSTWTDAFTDLQSALTLPSLLPGDEIWVAEGTYRPTNTTDRTETFLLPNGVAVYGGFHLMPVGAEVFAERLPNVYETVLSGDIGVGGDPSDNSYHVVSTGAGNGPTTILDGFTITDGFADVPPEWQGGGWTNDGGSPTLNNVVFIANEAYDAGGGMFNSTGSPRLTNVTFIGNRTLGGGGGFANDGGSPVMIDVIFQENYAFHGGALASSGGSLILANAAFRGNTALYNVGGLTVTDTELTIINAEFVGNTAEG